MENSKILNKEQARQTIFENVGGYQLWSDLHDISEELYKKTSGFSSNLLTGSMEDEIEMVVSVETSLAKLMALSDIIGLAPSNNIISAVWSGYFFKSKGNDDGRELETVDGSE